MYDFGERAAIYLRKSRMDPDSESVEETLSRHEDTLMKLSSKLGLNITGIYKEIVSGDGLFTRPQMVELLKDVGQDKYTGIVCMEIDRLGRSSQRDSGTVFETLKEHNVAIITPNKIYDLNDEFDETSVEMQSFIARQELKSIKRRLRKGAEKTCEQGGHISEPPFGYRRTYINKRPTLEICDEEAQIVRMIFDWYVNDRLGSHTIAKKLNQMGLKPRKGEKFSRTTVRFFLSNPTYTGKIVWNRQRHIRPKYIGDKHKNISNPQEKWIVADGIHPAIIEQELFDKAQMIRRQNTRPPTFSGMLQNPFAGLIYCKNCGLPMQRQYSSSSGSRLLCTTAGCNRSIKTEYIEERITDLLQYLFKNSKMTASKQSSNHDLRPEICQSTINRLRQELKTAYNQKENIHNLLERQVYDADTFSERNKILSDKIKHLEMSISDETHKFVQLRTEKETHNTAPYIGTLLKNYGFLTPPEKNELLKLVFSRIEYLRSPSMHTPDFELDIKLNNSI